MTNEEQELYEKIRQTIENGLQSYVNTTITPELLKTVEDYVHISIGPHATEWSIKAKQDEIFKDRVVVTVSEPLPLNEIDITLNG
jgi:DNA replication initiation complex subunit (GINS family)